MIIMVLALIVGRAENWSKFDSIYWAFITALSVGYGDLRPSQTCSKILALIISLIGIMLFGVIAAIAVNTFALAFHDSVKLP
jgi:voltage-gated potassium channel